MNGNDLKGFFDTPERATAWAFRTLIALLMSSTTIVGYLAWGTLQDLKSELKEQTRSTWQNMSTLQASQNQTAVSLSSLAVTVTDHIKRTEQIESDLHDELRDHEARIRTLERPATH